METKEISVERYVEQVRNGTHYKGYIKIDGTKFEYELIFAVPVARLDSMKQPKDVDDIRRLFQITVKRDDSNIELTMEEYGFFFTMFVEFAVEFYNSPQTRDSNEGLLGMAMRGEGSVASFVASVSIGMNRIGQYDFPLELCEMLSAQKFGCNLVVV